MQPDASYKQLQSYVKTVVHSNPILRDHLADLLTKKIMAAFQLKRGDIGPGCLIATHFRIVLSQDLSFYTGADGQQIIVTQPYHFQIPEARRTLTLDNGMCPEIIDASEWSIHNPGRSKLIIIIFPHGYAAAMESFRPRCQQPEHQERQEREETFTEYNPDADEPWADCGFE